MAHDYVTFDPRTIPGWAPTITERPRPFVPTVTITLAEYEDLKFQRDTLLDEQGILAARVNEQAERIALALCTLDPWDDEEDEEEDDEEGDEA